MVQATKPETIKTQVLQWFAEGDTGTSSESLALELVGLTLFDKWGNDRVDTPHDPDDLGRCLRLIAKIPEVRKCVDSLALKYSQWATLAPHWDEVAAMMADEVGIDWSKGRSAKRTFDRMRDILDAKEA